MYNHLDKSPETYTEWKQLVSNGFILYHSVYMTFLKWQKFQEFERISRIWASLVAQRVKHLPAMRETWVRSLGREDPLEEEMATHSSTLAMDLKNPMDGGAWWATVRGVAKSRTRLSDFTFFYFQAYTVYSIYHFLLYLNVNLHLCIYLGINVFSSYTVHTSLSSVLRNTKQI